MYCSKCGKELKENEKICSECNTTIKTNTTEQVKNTLKNFWNKAKETYKNAMPKIPTLEIEFNEDIEKILLDMSFKCFYSNINGEKLRLYKYYVGGYRVEIEIFMNDFADIYIYARRCDILNYALTQIMYDIVKLKDYIYVRYLWSDERIKLLDFCTLSDIIPSKESIKIKPKLIIQLNNNLCSKLEELGYTKKYNYKNDGSCELSLVKQEIDISCIFENSKDVNLAFDIEGHISISKNYSTNYYNNNVIENILELLKIKEYIEISDYSNEDFSKISLSSFLSKDSFIYELSQREIEEIEDEEFSIKFAMGSERTSINTKRTKRN